MALIQCPECGKEISSLARCCIHCGCPMDLPEEEDARYALVLLDAGPDREATLRQLVQWTRLTPEAADEWLRSLPFLLDTGLPLHPAQEAQRAWDKCCRVKVVREENAASAQQAAAAPGVDFDRLRRAAAPKPVTFWTIVGGALTALLLWTAASFLLAHALHLSSSIPI